MFDEALWETIIVHIALTASMWIHSLSVSKLTLIRNSLYVTPCPPSGLSPLTCSRTVHSGSPGPLCGGVSFNLTRVSPLISMSPRRPTCMHRAQGT